MRALLRAVIRYQTISVIPRTLDPQRLMEVLGTLSFALRVLVEIYRVKQHRKRSRKRADLVKVEVPSETDSHPK